MILEGMLLALIFSGEEVPCTLQEHGQWHVHAQVIGLAPHDAGVLALVRTHEREICVIYIPASAVPLVEGLLIVARGQTIWMGRKDKPYLVATHVGLQAW